MFAVRCFRCDEVIPCVDFGWPDLAPGQDYVRFPGLWPGVDVTCVDWWEGFDSLVLLAEIIGYLVLVSRCIRGGVM